MAARKTCRYCGAPAHIPADSCLTLGQKVGRIVGVTGIYVLGLLLLIGTVVWLASTGEPERPGELVCEWQPGGTQCEYR